MLCLYNVKNRLTLPHTDKVQVCFDGDRGAFMMCSHNHESFWRLRRREEQEQVTP